MADSNTVNSKQQNINMNERNILENAQYDFIGLRDIQNVNVYGLFLCERFLNEFEGLEDM